MPSPETSHLNQKALLWAASGFDDYGASTVGSVPTEIDVRWEWGKKEGINNQGDPIAWEATVVVDQEIAIGSVMWKGKRADYSTTETKMTVVDYREVPDIKGRRFRRIVHLARLSNTLPT